MLLLSTNGLLQDRGIRTRLARERRGGQKNTNRIDEKQKMETNTNSVHREVELWL